MTIDTIEKGILEFKKQREELKGWLYGTIYKQYDLEETAETVQEDVDRYFSDEWIEKLLSQAREEAGKENDKQWEKYHEILLADEDRIVGAVNMSLRGRGCRFEMNKRRDLEFFDNGDEL